MPDTPPPAAPTSPHPEESRLLWPDVAKAIAILLVVLVHSRAELAFIGIVSNPIDEFFGAATTVYMPLFFFVSGLFALGATQSGWGALWNKRLLNLTWLFLAWQPLVLAYKCAETLWLPNQPEDTLTGQLLRFVVSPVRPNGELWFLWVLIAFFVVLRLARRAPAALHLGVAVALSGAWLGLADDVFSAEQLRALGNGWGGLPAYYLFFAAGALGRDRILAAAARIRASTVCLAVMLWAAAYIVARVTNSADALGVSLALRILGVGAGVCLAQALSWSRPLTWIGQRTLQIYVTHIAVVVALTIVAYRSNLTPLGAAASAIVVVAVALVALMSALAIHAALSRTRGRFMYEPPPTIRRRLSVTRRTQAMDSSAVT